MTVDAENERFHFLRFSNGLKLAASHEVMFYVVTMPCVASFSTAWMFLINIGAESKNYVSDLFGFLPLTHLSRILFRHTGVTRRT